MIKRNKLGTKFSVGDRVRLRDYPRGCSGTITKRDIAAEYVYVRGDGGYRYGVQWDDHTRSDGYRQSTLELAPNGLEVAWEWLEANGYD
jgi:hypothetical protein